MTEPVLYFPDSPQDTFRHQRSSTSLPNYTTFPPIWTQTPAETTPSTSRATVHFQPLSLTSKPRLTLQQKETAPAHPTANAATIAAETAPPSAVMAHEDEEVAEAAVEHHPTALTAKTTTAPATTPADPPTPLHHPPTAAAAAEAAAPIPDHPTPPALAVAPPTTTHPTNLTSVPPLRR